MQKTNSVEEYAERAWSWQNVGLEFCLSVTVTVFIVNMVCFARLQYGSRMITHLTTRPYKISLWVLVARAVEVFGYILSINVIFADSWDEFTRSFMKNGAAMYFFNVIASARFTLLNVFVFSRAFEHGALVLFIYYQ